MIKRENIISFLRTEWSLFVKLEFPSPKDVLCQARLKLAQRFWRRNFFNCVKVFSLFCNFPQKKGVTLHLNKHKSPSPFIWLNHQRMLCAKIVQIGPVVLEKIFKILQCIFAILAIISNWERVHGLFI